MTTKLQVTQWLFFSCNVLICVGSLVNLQALIGQAPSVASKKLEWSALPNLPNDLGVAGPFIGVHNDALMVAGGANFQLPVWDNQKTWLDDIWVLSKTDSGFMWRMSGKLPRPLAYGASVSTARGVVCMGGNDKHQNYRDVFLLKWDATLKRVKFEEYPPLPSPFAYGQATLVGNVIYVAGGQSGLQLDSAMSNLWSLNLADEDSPDKFQWRELPAMPRHSRAFNITAHQHNGDQDCIYVIGGRYQVDGEVQFLNDVWEFNPESEVWRQRANLPRCLTAGTGIGFGERQIFLLGGDDGSLFSRTDELKDEHPGFRKEALVYDTESDRWTSTGATPQNQVTTIPVVWDDRIIIASGEVRPRVRTPAVWSVKVLER